MPNPEQPIQENLADIKKPQEQEPGLEIAKGPELKNIVDTANNLAEKIQRDEDVTFGEILDLEEALGNAKINIGGIPTTINEIKRDPNILKQMEITNKIIAKDFANIDVNDLAKLTFLPSEVATSLIDWPIDRPMIFDNVKTLSLEAIKALSSWKGDQLFLGGISSLSAEQATIINDWQGSYLSLFGLEDLSDEAAKELSQFKGTIAAIPKVLSKLEKYKKNI